MENQSQALAIRLHPDDNVVVARVDLEPGARLPEEDLVCQERVPAGHKVATGEIAPGQPVRKYGQVIGFASAPIDRGGWVHTHNLEVRDFARDYAPGTETTEEVIRFTVGRQRCGTSIVNHLP